MNNEKILLKNKGKEFHIQTGQQSPLLGPNLEFIDVINNTYMSPAELRELSKLIMRYADYINTAKSNDWDAPVYRQLCIDLGLDPDALRPSNT